MRGGALGRGATSLREMPWSQHDLPDDPLVAATAATTLIGLKSYATETNAILIRGNSHAARTADELTRELNGRQVDFLFIDGDHT